MVRAGARGRLRKQSQATDARPAPSSLLLPAPSTQNRGAPRNERQTDRTWAPRAASFYPRGRGSSRLAPQRPRRPPAPGPAAPPAAPSRPLTCAGHSSSSSRRPRAGPRALMPRAVGLRRFGSVRLGPAGLGPAPQNPVPAPADTESCTCQEGLSAGGCARRSGRKRRRQARPLPGGAAAAWPGDRPGAGPWRGRGYVGYGGGGAMGYGGGGATARSGTGQTRPPRPPGSQPGTCLCLPRGRSGARATRTRSAQLLGFSSLFAYLLIDRFQRERGTRICCSTY